MCNISFSNVSQGPQCGAVFFSYAIVTKDFAKLFVGQSCLNADALKALEDEKVEVLPYEGFFETLSSLELCTGEEVCLSDPSEQNLTRQQKVLLGGKASLAIANAIGRVSITHGTVVVSLTSI